MHIRVWHMDINRRKLANRELLKLRYQEKELEKAAAEAKPPQWKKLLEKKIPEKVSSGLESAFCTAFSLVFRQGRTLIEKTYKKEELRRHHALRDWKVKTVGSRSDLQEMDHSVRKSDNRNMAVTTAEGIALGAMGVGLPDIVLFLSTLLKGIYETAIHYGFEYESIGEQYLILKMMSASLKSGDYWKWDNKAVDKLLESELPEISEEMFREQIRRTAADFAMDMLLLKFIQGMPVVGFLGGAANPVYYQKIMRYIHLKYKKRYLMKRL